MNSEAETSTARAIATRKTPPTEIEAKFTLTDAALLRALATDETPVPGYAFGEPAASTLQDVYLDTPDYRILRHGYQLRVRTGAGGWLVTLKGRGVASEIGIYQRLEMEAPLERESLPADAGELPEPVAAAVREIAGKHAALSPICVLDQVRQVRAVTSESPNRRGEESPFLMQMYLDEVRIRAAVDEAVLAQVYEVEVELVQGVDLAELQVLADRLMGSYGLLPSAESKLERSLRIVSRHPVDAPENWQGIAPDFHMGEACRIIWHEQFMALLLNEAGVRYSADAEYVHAARVAIRRARAAARLYRSYFKRKSLRRFPKHVRKTARLLGAVRDLDVAITKLLGYQQKSGKKRSADLQATLEEWMARRAAAHQELVAWFDSAEYAAFVTDFLRFCRTPGAGVIDFAGASGETIVPFQVRTVAPAMLLTNFVHVRAYETAFERAEQPPLDTLHQLRIECKYLRYNLEFMSGLLGDDSGALIASLKELQDDLGDLNDAAVSKQLLAGASDGAGDGDDEDNAVVARYESAQDKTIARLRTRTQEAFGRFIGAENRLRLFRAIANI